MPERTSGEDGRPALARSRAASACLVLGLAMAGLSASAGAVERWSLVPTEPYTLNNKQDALAFPTPVTGFYGNGTGRVYRSDDRGRHWRAVWRHPGTYVRALDFADAKTGWLGNVGPGYFPDVTDPTPLYVTHDAGVSWTPVQPVDGPKVVGICALDVLKDLDGRVVAVRAGGRVGGPAGLLESVDGGQTFHARDMSAVTGMILDIHFLDPTTGFMAGASASDEGVAHARILKTTDAGQSWRAVFDSARAGDNNWKLAFPSARVGYATIISYGAPQSEAEGYVVKTVDGGEHWTPLTVTRDHAWIPYGINFVTETHGWVGGSTGGYETTDGGTSWHKVAMGLSTNKIRFVAGEGGSVAAFAIGEGLYRLDLPEGR